MTCLAEKDTARIPPAMGRKPLGGAGTKTLLVPLKWSEQTLARIDAARGSQDRSAFIRQAVEEKLSRKTSPD